MKRAWQRIPKRRILVNYIGGLGYYCWYFAVLLILLQLTLQAMRYLVVSSPPMYDQPMLSTSSSDVMGVGEMSVLSTVLSVLFIGLACVMVLTMPYYVGWLSRRVPRWVISQTNNNVTVASLHNTRQIACIVTILVATALLFAPREDSLVNALYLTILVTLLGAMSCFWLQQKIATRWQIPERHLF